MASTSSAVGRAAAEQGPGPGGRLLRAAGPSTPVPGILVVWPAWPNFEAELEVGFACSPAGPDPPTYSEKNPPSHCQHMIRF